MKIHKGNRVVYQQADCHNGFRFTGKVVSTSRIRNSVAPHDRAMVIIDGNEHMLHSIECCQDYLTRQYRMSLA